MHFHNSSSLIFIMIFSALQYFIVIFCFILQMLMMPNQAVSWKRNGQPRNDVSFQQHVAIKLTDFSSDNKLLEQFDCFSQSIISQLLSACIYSDLKLPNFMFSILQI